MASLAVIQIMAGCGVNVIFLEMITSRDKGSGSLITLAQFLFVACQGLASNLGTPRKIPLWLHCTLTCIYFMASIVNNMALNFGVSMPLHMVFRSSSLAASLCIGYMVFGKSYSRNQIIGVALVSMGIVITTLADAVSRGSCCDIFGAFSSAEADLDSDDDEVSRWLTGMGMLTFALLLSALLGHLQDHSNRAYGKCSEEMKFYSHLLALPYFYALQKDSIMDHVEIWNSSAGLKEHIPVELARYLPSSFSDIPFLWYLLLMNVLSQLICITAVYRLTAISSTLTTTMTLTVRKFFSIIISVVYFQNPFSRWHWAGTVLVFSGALTYSGHLVYPFAGKTKQS